MNRTRTLNGVTPYKAPIELQPISSNFVFPDNEETKLLQLVYGDGNDISLYLNKNTRPEVRQAIENLLVAHNEGTKYPDDVLAFEMQPREFESRQQYAERLQGIINQSYKDLTDEKSN